MVDFVSIYDGVPDIGYAAPKDVDVVISHHLERLLQPYFQRPTPSGLGMSYTQRRQENRSQNTMFAYVTECDVPMLGYVDIGLFPGLGKCPCWELYDSDIDSEGGLDYSYSPQQMFTVRKAVLPMNTDSSVIDSVIQLGQVMDLYLQTTRT